ncbi:MBL fold metallo-hydrolase [Patescibacteria group bacterium]|nr:MBL fold metallo-hydrolase [Patescibacteria group bacterium]MBU1922397.1 MBL fold metallo-hydrolase [Patescibacteria group bacterium]
MQITWHGLSCFKIQGKVGGEEISIVIDPYQKTTGLKLPRSFSADIVLISENRPEQNNGEGVGGNPFIIKHPGEFEVRGVFIYGINIFKNGEVKEGRRPLIYRIELEGIRIAHLGTLYRPLKDEELAALREIDIVTLPVGGGPVISPQQADELVSQIEPRIVIPMYFSVPGVKEKLATVDKFCKEIGICASEKLSKLKINKKDLPQEDMQVITLEKS